MRHVEMIRGMNVEEDLEHVFLLSLLRTACLGGPSMQLFHVVCHLLTHLPSLIINFFLLLLLFMVIKYSSMNLIINKSTMLSIERRNRLGFVS